MNSNQYRINLKSNIKIMMISNRITRRTSKLIRRDNEKLKRRPRGERRVIIDEINNSILKSHEPSILVTCCFLFLVCNFQSAIRPIEAQGTGDGLGDLGLGNLGLGGDLANLGGTGNSAGGAG